jgi:hypothetical protein
MGTLMLKRASASRPSGEWNEDGYDVMEDSAVVGSCFSPFPSRGASLFRQRASSTGM